MFALFIAIIAFVVGLLAWLRPRPVVARKQDLEEGAGLCRRRRVTRQIVSPPRIEYCIKEPMSLFAIRDPFRFGLFIYESPDYVNTVTICHIVTTKIPLCGLIEILFAFSGLGLPGTI